MSFKCDECGKAQDTGTKPITVIAEDRVQHYENRYRRNYKTVTVNSTGWEIVKEKKVCAECVTENTDEEKEPMKVTLSFEPGLSS